MADLWKNHLPVFYRDGRLAFELFDLGIGEAIIAIISLEAWEACSVALFAPLEEGLERFVHPLQRVLEHLRIDLFVLRTKLFDLGQLSRLHLIGDTDTTHMPSFASFL